MFRSGSSSDDEEVIKCCGVVDVHVVPDDDVDEVPIGEVVRPKVVPCDAVVDVDKPPVVEVNTLVDEVPGSY